MLTVWSCQLLEAQRNRHGADRTAGRGHSVPSLCLLQGWRTAKETIISFLEILTEETSEIKPNGGIFPMSRKARNGNKEAESKCHV